MVCWLGVKCWELLTRFRNEVRISRLSLDIYVQVPVCCDVTLKHPDWRSCSHTDLFGQLNSCKKCSFKGKNVISKRHCSLKRTPHLPTTTWQERAGRSLAWYFLEKDAMHSIQTAKSMECQTTSVESFHLLSHRGC